MLMCLVAASVVAGPPGTVLFTTLGIAATENYIVGQLLPQN